MSDFPIENALKALIEKANVLIGQAMMPGRIVAAMSTFEGRLVSATILFSDDQQVEIIAASRYLDPAALANAAITAILTERDPQIYPYFHDDEEAPTVWKDSYIAEDGFEPVDHGADAPLPEPKQRPH